LGLSLAGASEVEMRPEIYKVEKIGNGYLAVMARPRSGEWIDEEFQGISDFGINQIVSLLGNSESFALGLKDERCLTESNGMTFLSFPIRDCCLPSSIEKFIELTKRLHQEITQGENTVIHCRAGIGRTGIVAAGILLHGGFTAEDAFEKISEKRKVQVPDTQEQKEWIISNAKIIIR